MRALLTFAPKSAAPTSAEPRVATELLQPLGQHRCLEKEQALW